VGELDALAAPQLEAETLQILEDGAECCIVDLSSTGFIDSIGVGSLIRLHRSAQSKNSSVFIAGARGMISQLIQVTQLHRVFRVFDSLEEARSAAVSDMASVNSPGV